MDLLTRQQAQHHWFEADSRAKFDDLLQALSLYKDISMEYGLNRCINSGDLETPVRNPETLIGMTMR